MPLIISAVYGLLLTSLCINLALALALECPKVPGANQMTLDISDVPSMFKQKQMTITAASSSSECKAKALAKQCQGSTSGFFIFTKQGFKNSKKAYLGNCAFGSACASLKAGNTPSVTGKLPAADAHCPKKGKNGATSLACPLNSSPKTAFIDVSKIISLIEKRIVTMVPALSAKSCRHFAQVESCNGHRFSFYVYSRFGFRDASGQSLGKCALSRSCFPMVKGISRVTAGNADAEWCPSQKPLFASA